MCKRPFYGHLINLEMIFIVIFARGQRLSSFRRIKLAFFAYGYGPNEFIKITVLTILQTLNFDKNYINATDFFLSLFVVIFRTHIQQPIINIRMQKQRRVCHQQEKSHGMQGVSITKMPSGRNVKERFAIRKTIKLVQDSLPSPRATEQGE